MFQQFFFGSKSGIYMFFLSQNHFSVTEVMLFHIKFSTNPKRYILLYCLELKNGSSCTREGVVKQLRTLTLLVSIFQFCRFLCIVLVTLLLRNPTSGSGFFGKKEHSSFYSFPCQRKPYFVGVKLSVLVEASFFLFLCFFNRSILEVTLRRVQCDRPNRSHNKYLLRAIEVSASRNDFRNVSPVLRFFLLGRR